MPLEGLLVKLAIAFKKKATLGLRLFISIVSRMPGILLKGYYQVELLIEWSWRVWPTFTDKGMLVQPTLIFPRLITGNKFLVGPFFCD